MSHVSTVLPTHPRDTRAVLAEIEEIRSGLWDERIKVSLGIASPEPTPDAPTTWNVPEVHEEPTNEVEDSPMIDAEPPEPQDEQIIIYGCHSLKQSTFRRSLFVLFSRE